jgi:hypothetical protein
LPNGDEIYSVTAVYLTFGKKGNIEIDYTETFDLQYFNINELPKGINKANQNYIEVYLKKYQVILGMGEDIYMIWLFIIVPLLVLIAISIYIDRKNNGLNGPPDVNKGNRNIETEANRQQFYNNDNGGSN